MPIPSNIAMQHTLSAIVFVIICTMPMSQCDIAFHDSIL